MPDAQKCGDFNDCPIASSVQKIAADNARQTALQEQTVRDVASLKQLLLGPDGQAGLNSRVGNLERRAETHDLAAVADRAKREKRYAFWSRVFWAFIAPVFSAAGAWFFLQLVGALSRRHP